MNVREILALGPVMPVIVLNKVSEAVPLARALVAGGIRVLEVTLRTPAALACVRAIRAEVPDAGVGFGTLTRAHKFAAAAKPPAPFCAHAGLTPAPLSPASA